MRERFIEAKPHTLVVNEIFYSIQGESTHAGRPCVFVRLTYCNIRCSYCDTDYAFYDGREMSIDEIVGSIKGHGCNLVEITGGEPLFQTNVHELMTRLCDGGYEVLIETGGSIDIKRIDPRVKRIVDFKCPSSKMVKNNLWENVRHLKDGDEVKFVIGDREDYEWSKHKINEYTLVDRFPVLLSVVFSELEPIRLAEWILEDKLNVQLQLQVHKYIWTPQKRGV